MPVYDFTCETCGDFRVLRMISERNDPAPCPSCARLGRRLILAPNLAVMAPLQRKAASINEKSRHEPRVSGGSHSCGSGCGCGTPVRNKKLMDTKLGKVQTQKANARPWMLGH
ncbi:MAG: zinc ribbon domain-containing protein [Luteolibacter sp.]